MALVSPGVELNVINESFYSPASPGTVPAIFVASAENKINASGSGIAAGTLKSNSEKPMLVSSQRELAELFGDPSFHTDFNNTSVHGGELNEYGLQTAYDYLGSYNRAWVLRADLDLAQLNPSVDPPAGNPRPGTYWLDTNLSKWGVFVWNGDGVELNGQRFESVEPIVVYEDYEMVYGTFSQNGTDGYIPKQTIGKVGSYAMVFGSTVAKLFYRNRAGTWVLVGSDKWRTSFPVISNLINASASVHIPESNMDDVIEATLFSQMSATFMVDSVSIEVEMFDSVQDVADKINAANISGVSATSRLGRLEIFSDGTPGIDGEIEISGDDILLNELGFNIEESGGSKKFYLADLHIDSHTKIPQFKKSDDFPRPTGSIWIKTTELGGGAKLALRLWNDNTNMWDDVDSKFYKNHQTAIYEMDRTSGGLKIDSGSVYVQYNVAQDEKPLATFKVYKKSGNAPTQIIGSTITQDGVDSNTYTIKMQSTDAGSPTFSEEKSISFTTSETSMDAEVISGAIAGAEIPNVTSSVTSDNRIVIKHELGGNIRIIDDENHKVLNRMGFASYRNINQGTPNLYFAPGTNGNTEPLTLEATLWKATVDIGDDVVSFYVPGKESASFMPDHGQLWYNSIIDEVDIMINNGTKWVGYRNFNNQYSRTDPNGPIITASMPETQSDGTSLVTGDIWIDTSDIENYPIIRIFNNDLRNMTSVISNTGMDTEQDSEEATKRSLGWMRIDNTDQNTENGIVFADARYNSSGESSQTPGTISDLLNSNYVDPDVPDPVLYPRGTLLWNTRRSGFNVKRFVHNHINSMVSNARYLNESMNDYYLHRWVTESPNQYNGAGSFGRAAQRSVVVQSLKRMISTNNDIRDTESRIFNIMATPGYPELIGEMVSLNYDRRLSSFIIGDTPARLNPSSTEINEWANNTKQAIEDNDDGLVTFNDYVGMYYPWGFTNDNFGKDILMPPSYMALATIAYSDQISYPWFAPAGVRRGTVNNVSSVGYLNDQGEYQTVALNNGQRDTLYENKLNPIAYMGGTGIIIHGQKTRSGSDSAMDRINVARLVIYLRRMLEVAARPFIYQPNDKITRDEIRNVYNGILLDLMGKRALSDFLVVCDESNNTPTRVRRNELWIDVAIAPINAVEFIYIPLRLQSYGQNG